MIVDGVGYTPGQIRRLVRERHELATQLAEYDRRINWDTTCGSCANFLDASIRDFERAEKAEEENTRLNLRVTRLQRAAESQQVHLQRRTAALVRLIARKGPRLS